MAALSSQAHSNLERVARDSYGRLVAWLAWKLGDLSAAEDAMSEALAKALEHWPRTGIPDQPETWLLTVAKRELLQKIRSDKVRSDPGFAVLFDNEVQEGMAQIPDARLRLMAVCCHPAIDEKIRMPLMLQCVLGLTVDQIAPAMLTSPTVLAQRLVRAKQKIKVSGIRFHDADTDELPEQLSPILEAIYGLFSLSAYFVDGADSTTSDFESEALFLSELVRRLAPQNPEATGLWALLTFVKARNSARRTGSQAFIPLAEQDTNLWDRALIQQADQALWQASQMRAPGPYQLEAAIQSAHCQRLFSGVTQWRAIASLYANLVQHFPTVGAVVGYSVALGEIGYPATGLEQLKTIDSAVHVRFQPWWVARAYLLELTDADKNKSSASSAYETAIGLTDDPCVRAHLMQKMSKLN